jgi:hypothetical protein
MAYVELNLDQGTTFETTLSLTNDDATTINVTNYTFTSQIRKSFYSSNASANITVSIVDAPNGNVKLAMTPANTANIKAGRYLYDVLMTDSTGVKTRVIEGIITITPRVTR